MTEVQSKIAHEKWVPRDWKNVKTKLSSISQTARFEWDYGLIIRELQGTDNFKNWSFKRFNWI